MSGFDWKVMPLFAEGGGTGAWHRPPISGLAERFLVIFCPGARIAVCCDRRPRETQAVDSAELAGAADIVDVKDIDVAAGHNRARIVIRRAILTP